MFLAFDVEILYLFPVAVAYDRVSGLRGIVELVIFIGILALAAGILLLLEREKTVAEGAGAAG